jgi:superfamily II DNA or RNA helicase
MKTRDQIQKEALDILIPNHRAGVGITMGGGKTLVGLKHMDHHWDPDAMFLVVAPKTSIFEEWKSQAEEHGLSHLTSHMDFTTYLSLSKQIYMYDVIYLDECHSLLYTHAEWLRGYKGKIVGLTGTPPKFKSSQKGKMVDQFCPIMYTYQTDEAIEDKILNDYKIIVHKIPLDAMKTIKMNSKGKEWYASEQSTYAYWTNRVDSAYGAKELQIMRVMRMKALMDFPSKERLAKKLMNSIKDKVILFANTQEQADKLCAHSYHSKNPLSEENLKTFKEGKIKKLSAVLQLSEGVNIPNLKQGIIMHAYGNERKSSQRIGRLLRLNPNEESCIHILCYKDTIDEHWVKSALETFDQSKIEYVQD